ncbi:MAG: DNA adenine methylase [Sediminispirochaetaceae bacterium]
MPEWYQAHQLSTSDRAFVSTDYLTRQLIAYIGNKRRILGFLYRIFRGLGERHRLTCFADPFAGSGAVARLARQMGMEVYANDWEEYSRVINSAYLTTRPGDLNLIYQDRGGLQKVLDTLNALQGPPKRPYISSHYAPRDTAAADYRTERLFYTRENALFIDRVREKIEEWYPEDAAGRSSENRCSRARDILLSLLLYEAATHVNTSGVFKAYHKGFGGHGRDALSRIMAPMHLEHPVLHPSGAAAVVEKTDAAAFLTGRSADLCYLDPPYTIHQYGSNYHILNTIALWDYLPVDNRLGPDGRLMRKGGIREDWTDTRSDFCYARTAPGALEEVMQAADARYVVLSYNSEGVITVEELLDILSGFGRIEINSLEYITFRGGRQSIQRRTHNTEFQIVVERTGAWGKAKTIRSENADAHDSADTVKENVKPILLAFRIQSLLRGAFVPQRLKARFPVEEDEGCSRESGDSRIRLTASRGSMTLRTEQYYRFLDAPSISELKEIPLSELRTICRWLEESACADRQEELQVLLDILHECSDARTRDLYQRRILHVLKKFTHRKYLRQWTEEMERLEHHVMQRDGDLNILRKGLADLRVLARRRLEG